MKAELNVRVLSAAEQGVTSLTNFLVIVLVSRFGDVESVANFSLLFGLCFLSSRIHFALIAMPLSIQSGRLNVDHGQLVKKYVGYSYVLAVISVLLIVPILFVFDVLWLHLDAGFEAFIFLSSIIGLLPLVESVRRILITVSIYYAIGYSLLNGSVLLLSVYYFVTSYELSGAFVFVAYFPIIIIALIYLWLRRRCSFDVGDGFLQHSKREFPLVVNSIFQWSNGYAPIYVAAVLLNANAVSFIVLLRNFFGPLNIMLLSLESYMPRNFKRHLDVSGYDSFYKAIYKELVISLLIVSIVCMPLLIYKVELFGYIYGADKYAASGDSMFYIYFLSYSILFASRIFSIGLRVRGSSLSLAHGTGVGTSVLLILLLPFAKFAGGVGVLSAMLLSEIAIAMYYKSMFDKKII